MTASQRGAWGGAAEHAEHTAPWPLPSVGRTTLRRESRPSSTASGRLSEAAASRPVCLHRVLRRSVTRPLGALPLAAARTRPPTSVPLSLPRFLLRFPGPPSPPTSPPTSLPPLLLSLSPPESVCAAVSVCFFLLCFCSVLFSLTVSLASGPACRPSAKKGDLQPGEPARRMGAQVTRDGQGYQDRALGGWAELWPSGGTGGSRGLWAT